MTMTKTKDEYTKELRTEDYPELNHNVWVAPIVYNAIKRKLLEEVFKRIEKECDRYPKDKSKQILTLGIKEYRELKQSLIESKSNTEKITFKEVRQEMKQAGLLNNGDTLQ